MAGDKHFWSEYRSRFNNTNAYSYYISNTEEPCFLFLTTRTLKNLQQYIQCISRFIYKTDQEEEANDRRGSHQSKLLRYFKTSINDIANFLSSTLDLLI